jgi:hypothetical protein
MMMDHMMGGGMMWGMGLIGLLVIIVLILAAAALVKYLFFNKTKNYCGGEPGLAAMPVHMRDQLRQGRMNRGLATAKMDGGHAAIGEPIEAVNQDARVRMRAVGRGKAKAASRVAVPRYAKADCERQFRRVRQRRDSESMLQKSAPCSIASSKAT